MLYVDSRPANIFAKPQAPAPRFYQHSQAVRDAAPVAARLGELLEAEREDEGTQTLFTVPGRPDYVMTLDGDDNFELRTRVGEDGELSVWEHTVREQLPMKRGLRARIGQRIPRIRPALMTYDDGQSLGEAFVKRRLRAVASRVHRRVFRGEGVQVSLTEHTMEEGGEVVTLTLRSENPEALRRVLATLDLEKGLDVDRGKTEAIADVLRAA